MIEVLPPAKKRILIFDNHGSEHVQKVLPKNSFSILFVRHEKFNLYILFKTFLKFKFRYRDYLKTYIEHVRPKILITTIDNNKFFYQINFKFLKKISIQNARRTGIPEDLFFNIKEKKLKLFCDIIFTHNDSIASLYKKNINSKTYSIGSLRSNFFPVRKNILFKLGYVSTFRDRNINQKLYNNYFYGDFRKAEVLLINHLKKYSIERNIKLIILGCEIKDWKKEKEFYDSFLGKNYIFIKNSENRNTYSLIDKFEILAGIDSTLIYENFGRGNKTAFFSYRSMKYPFDSRKFAWPAKIKIDNSFCTSKKDYKNFKKVIDFVLRCNKNKWKTIYRKYFKYLMFYDSKNKKIKSYINQILKEI